MPRRGGAIQRLLAGALLAAGLALLGPGTAKADYPPLTLQTQSDINDARRSVADATYTKKRQEAREEAYQHRGKCGQPPDISHATTLNASGQVSYAGNPTPDVPESGGDWHAHPDLELDYKWQGAVRFDGRLDVNSDRYLSATAADYDETLLLTKLSFNDGRDCSNWNPTFYVSNKLVDDFATTFSHSVARVDVLALGITASRPFNITQGKINTDTTPANADYVFSLDASAGRQQATPSNLNGEVLVLKANLSRVINDSWAFSVGSSLKITWLDSQSTHSTLSANTLVVKWTPQIPNGFDRKLEIDLTESFNSVHPGGNPSYVQNDVGPSLSWTWTLQ